MDDGKRKDLLPIPPDAGEGDAPGGPAGGERSAELKEKADAALEFARVKAGKLLDDVKLRKRIHDAKNGIADLHAAAGRAAREFLAAHTAIDPLLVSMLEEIDVIVGRLDRLEASEREAAAEKPREGLLDRLKQGAARAAGIAKYSLEKSLLARDREAAERALGECLALHADSRFVDLVAACPALADTLSALRLAEKKRSALEAELAALKSGEAAPPREG